MNTNLLSFLGFEQKISRRLANVFRHTCQNCFSLVEQTFRGKNILVKNYTYLSIFLGIEQKKDRSFANSIQHSCQVCISLVPQTLRGKTILLKSLQNCSSLWALSNRTFYPRENLRTRCVKSAFSVSSGTIRRENFYGELIDFSIISELWHEKLEFSDFFPSELWKLHFSCPGNILKRNNLPEKQSCSFSLEYEQWKTLILAK